MYDAVVIGTSMGGMQALGTLLGALPAHFPLPLAIVQHLEPRSDNYLAVHLDGLCTIRVKEAEDKEPMHAGTAYIAPAGYHLLVEPDRSFSLSVEEKVNYCRPAIDPLFESAADAFGSALIGVVLTGANADGALGLRRIHDMGGRAIVQNPQTAEAPFMPRSALSAVPAAQAFDLDSIAKQLMRLAERRDYGTG